MCINNYIVELFIYDILSMNAFYHKKGRQAALLTCPQSLGGRVAGKMLFPSLFNCF